MVNFDATILIILLGALRCTVFAQPTTSFDTTPKYTGQFSDKLKRDDHPDVAVIPYAWNCAIGGGDARIIKVGIELDAGIPKYVDVQNAEHVTSRVLTSNAASYHLVGSFYHATCLPKAGRMCGYSMTASLETTIDRNKNEFHFNIPRKGGVNNIAPVVIETCSAPGAKACPGAGIMQGTACKVVNISILKPWHP